MGDEESENRIIAACENCGSIYAALETNDGEIKPIGSRTGCTSCSGTEFTPIRAYGGEGESDRFDANG